MLLLDQIQAFDLIADTRNANPMRVISLQPIGNNNGQITVSGPHGLLRQITLENSQKSYLCHVPQQRLVRDPNAVLGCLLGGALGDACGAPVEFLEWFEIQKRFGSNGIQDLQPAYGKLGSVTDDTQMMLFTAAAQAAHLTHGHPSGYLSAGIFADILARLWQTPALSLAAATHSSLHEHRDKAGMHETYAALQKVLQLHHANIEPNPELIEAHLGGGWVAEEALAIGLWCALSAKDFTDGVYKAVNHSGDSNSTGLIAGHFLGLLLGAHALPSEWLMHLEMRDSIQYIATDLCLVPHQVSLNNRSEDAALWQRYPGW